MILSANKRFQSLFSVQRGGSASFLRSDRLFIVFCQSLILLDNRAELVAQRDSFLVEEKTFEL